MLHHINQEVYLLLASVGHSTTGKSQSQSRKEDLHVSNTRSCPIPFKVITSCEVVCAIFKSAAGYGSVYAKMEILCLGKDEDFWTPA